MKRKFSKADIETYINKLLDADFNKTGDHQVALEFIISQYVHLFGQVKRVDQIDTLSGIMCQIKEIQND